MSEPASEPVPPDSRHPPDEAPAHEVLRLLAVDAAGEATDLPDLDALAAALVDGSVCLWIDAANPSPATLDRIGSILDIHPLVVEDIREQNQRAKSDEHAGALHIVLFAIHWAGEVTELEVDIVLSRRFLLTVHDPAWDPRDAPQLRFGPAALLARGTDRLLHGIVDWLVDGYFPVLDLLTDEIDELQDEVVERTSTRNLQRLFALKRELLVMRRATSPAREIFNQLTNRDHPFIQPAHVIYYRDVYDHLIRVTEELDTYRELVAGTLDVYLSSVNNNLSSIMKRLTGVTVILAGIGAVAGLFGMSEAGAAFAGGEPAGFWLVVAATVVGAVLVAIVLRRIDWI